MRPASTPYPGLRAFRPDEDDRFFGRDSCVDEMIDRLANSHLLAVVGSSGSGKSSLVKTGLLRGLKMGLIPGASSHWWIVDFKPGGAPLRNLAKKLLETEKTAANKSKQGDARPAEEPTDVDVELMRGFLMHSPRSVIDWYQGQQSSRDTNLLLLVDQFEELFRYDNFEAREEAEAFVALLIECVKSARDTKKFGSKDKSKIQIYVTLTMRSEFLGACSLIEGLAEEINRGMYLTPRMTREQCREAITGPARVLDFKIEEALVNRLLNDLEDFAPFSNEDKNDQLNRIARRADQLPLLQYTLNRMFALAKGKGEKLIFLRLNDYVGKEIDGLGGALNTHALEILGEKSSKEGGRFSADELPTVEAVFRALTYGPSVAEAVRRPTRLRDLIQICGGNEKAVRKVVDVFSAPGCNFLTMSDDGYVDISHESLIRQWKHLSEWLENEANAARLWERLLDSVNENETEKKKSRVEELLHGKLLTALTDLRKEQKINWAWAARYDDKLSSQHSLSVEVHEARAHERFEQATDLVSRSQQMFEHIELEREQREEEDRRREQEAREKSLKATAMENELRLMARAKRYMRNGVVAAGVLSMICVGAALFAVRQYERANADKKSALELFSGTLSDGALALYKTTMAGAKAEVELILRERVYSVTDVREKVKKISQACMYRSDPDDESIAKSFLESRYDLCDALAAFYANFNSKNEKGALNRTLEYANEARAIAGRLTERFPGDDARYKLARSYLRLGDAFQTKGDIANPVDTPDNPRNAKTAFGMYLQIMQSLAENTNTSHMEQWQRDLSQAYDRVGDLAVTLNDHVSARDNYEKKEQVTLRMVTYHDKRKDADQSNSIFWKGDEALNMLNLGDIHMLLDDHATAEAKFQELINIAANLRKQEPNNTKWQWYLALGHERIGDTMIKNGWKKRLTNGEDVAKAGNGALMKYQEFLALVSELATADPANVKWQRGLAIANERMGDAYLLLGKPDDAETYYLKDYRIARELNNNEPTNTEFRRDVSISQMKLGDVLLARRKLPDALAKYKEYQESAGKLVGEDRANADWQRDNAIGFEKVGLVLLERNDLPGAKQQFSSCIGVLNEFKNIKPYDPRNDRPVNVRELCEAGLKLADGGATVQPGGGK